MSQHQNPTVIVQQVPTNGMGTAGFVLSIVGWLFCGLLCPIGLLLSFIGLFKAPRGLAIAGFVLGVIGSIIPLIVIGFVGLGTIAAAVGLAESSRVYAEKERSIEAIREAHDGIQAWYVEHEGSLPSVIDGAAAIEIELAGGQFADWDVTYERVSHQEYMLTIDRTDLDFTMELTWVFDAETGEVVNKHIHTREID